MAFTQRSTRDAILPMSLDAACIECENKPQPDGEICPRCLGMSRSAIAASTEETRRLLSLEFTERNQLVADPDTNQPEPVSVRQSPQDHLWDIRFYWPIESLEDMWRPYR